MPSSPAMPPGTRLRQAKAKRWATPPAPWPWQAHWRFAELSQHDYERLYTQLRNSDLKVDAYADMNTLPDTPNVTVEKQN